MIWFAPLSFPRKPAHSLPWLPTANSAPSQTPAIFYWQEWRGERLLIGKIKIGEAGHRKAANDAEEICAGAE